MSLIVARRNGGNMYIVSDTKLTYPANEYPNQSVASPKEGIIKATIINHQICISFAGEVDAAEKAIRICRQLDFRINEIIEYLLRVNKETNGKTEFIACIGFPEYKIYEIKNLTLREVDAAWIGSNAAFSIFQEKALENNSTSKDAQSILDSAMDYVLNNGKIPEVNGFRVSVSNEGNFFHYRNYMNTRMPARTYTTTGNGFHVLDIYGSAQEGGYSVALYENEGRYDMVAIHVRQGEFGILYEINDGALLRPKIIPNVDEHEFSDLLFSKFGIKASALFSSLQKSYFRRGNKQYALKDFKKAIEFYEIGLSQNEDSLRAVLSFNKGLALLQLNRVNEACIDFDIAVKIDSTFELRVRNALSRLI
jgi:tetratricopeptide (TPR) repeat protein